MITVSVLSVVAVGLGAFAVGFSLCNVIYVFLLGSNKRNNRHNKTSNADKQGKN